MYKKSIVFIVSFIIVAMGVGFNKAAAETWYTETIDAPRNFDLYPGGSIAVDANGNPHVVYGQDHLYHAYYDGNNWQYETVDSQPETGLFSSIAIDSNGHIHISYLDSVNLSLKYATNASGSWNTETVDNNGFVGLSNILVIDPDNHVHISYFDYDNKALKYTTNTSGYWVIETVNSNVSSIISASIGMISDPTGHIHLCYNSDNGLEYTTNVSGLWSSEMVNSGGSCPAITLDSTGHVHISYSKSGLQYATNASGSWATESVDGNGSQSAIAMNSTGDIHISYWADGALKYANKTSGTWIFKTIENGGYAVSMAMDAAGALHIIHYDREREIWLVKYTTNIYGLWTTTPVDSPDKVSTFPSSGAIDANDKMHVVYSRTNSLWYATNRFGSWAPELVDGTIHLGSPKSVSIASASIAIDSSRHAHISYFNTLTGSLLYATNVSGSWAVEEVATGGYEWGHTSICIDPNNNVNIVFYDKTNSQLKYAKKESGSWLIDIVDSNGSVGYYNSIAADTNGHIHIAYNEDIYNDNLKYATNVSGSWVTVIVDGNGDVGTYNSIALDSENHVHISYMDFNNFDADLKYATNLSGNWVVSDVDTGGYVGQFSSIAVNSNHDVHIAYADRSTKALKYANNTSGNWVTEPVDIIGDVGGVCSMGIGLTNDSIHISYSDGTLGDLKYATTAKVWIVDTDGSGDFVTIQEAINAALDGDTVVVKKGTYIGEGNRNLDFQGKAITVRSESGPAETIIDCENVENTRGFYFHSGEVSQAIVSGFTIKNGKSDFGGGIHISSANPQIINCVLEDNTATNVGGGVYAYSSSPRILDCEFRGNSAVDGGGMGLKTSSPTVTGCQFTLNESDNCGGALHCTEDSSPDISACRIESNTAGVHGGGLHLYRHSKPEISNCLIVSNEAINNIGGAISLQDYANPTVSNCTIVGNTSGAIISHGYESWATIINSILWNNGTVQLTTMFAGEMSISFSNIQQQDGWTLGGSLIDAGGNIDQNPEFRTDESVDPAYLGIGDYHLTADSPCIDAGSNQAAPEVDIDGEPRPQGDTADMGYDEYTDIDGDQLPDYWENKWFGSLSQDGNTDSDQDGFTNAQEYRRGIDPTQYQDTWPPVIWTVDPTGKGDFLTIREGIENAIKGDTVLVKAGTYRIDLLPANSGQSNPIVINKDITLKGEDPETTIIKAASFGANNLDVKEVRMVEIRANARVEGFTFEIPDPLYDPSNNIDVRTVNGIQANGGDIEVVISNNRFLIGNSSENLPAEYSVTAVNLNALGIVTANRFTGSSPWGADLSPIGLYFAYPSGADVEVSNNLFSKLYGGMSLNGPETGAVNVRVVNNTIDQTWVGIHFSWKGVDCALGIMRNNIITYNQFGVVVHTDGTSITVGDHLTHDHNAYFGNNNHFIVNLNDVEHIDVKEEEVDSDPSNIIAAPGYLGGGDYHLTVGSPCINSGLNDAAPAVDIDGETRPHDTTADMGFDEYRDTDGDDIADTWELRWFGTLSYDGGADTDGDGFNDIDEYHFGTDPTDVEDFIVKETLYVDNNLGNDGYHGYLPNAAKLTIQAAIDAAEDGQTVLVMAGTYTVEGNVNLDFRGKKITVRSESGRAKTIIDCENVENTRGFYFHSGETSQAIVSGFTIKNGKSDFGGGIHISSANPQIINCVLEGNTATNVGGGVYAYSSSPRILDCEFRLNSAVDGGGMGLRASSPTVTGCQFTLNESDNCGGALHCTEHSSPDISACRIESNTAGSHGGGLHLYRHSKPEISNCLIVSNEAINNMGGAISLQDYANPRVSNCTIVGNTSGAIISHGYESWATIINSILWDNGTVGTVQLTTTFSGEMYISFSNIQQWEDGWKLGGSLIDAGGNINQDPRFRNTGDAPYGLLFDSPCIDAGSSIETLHSDLRGSIRPIDVNEKGNDSIYNNFDMGAYEYSASPNAMDDEAKKAFKDVNIGLLSALPDSYYDLKWSNNSPFPYNDQRIVGQGGSLEYDVRVLLESKSGLRKEITHIEDVPVQEPQEDDRYAYPVMFSKSHIGEWYIRLELADDPNQFVKSKDPITIGHHTRETWVLGTDITPENADPDREPVIEEGMENAFVQYEGALYPVQPFDEDPKPLETRIGWYDKDGDIFYVDGKVVVPDSEDPDNAKAKFRLQPHVAGTPAVALLPEGSGYANVELKYAKSDGAIEGVNQFTAHTEGVSVLLYWKGDIMDSEPMFEIVKTAHWDAMADHGISTDIGKEIVSNYHDSGFDRNGYVFNEISAYAVNTRVEEPYDGYDAATQTGPIIPVNSRLHPDYRNYLVVVWYGKGVSGAFWPYKPVRYAPDWPDIDVATDGIIIARTGDNDHQDISGLNNVEIYNQPDPALPGFNPNEEHALILNNKIYALRDDLNDFDNNGENDYSDPWVLLKYFDPSDEGGWRFKLFPVVAENGQYQFLYHEEVGALIQLPTPLNSLNICGETMPDPQTTAAGLLWEDYEGAVYARKPSAPGEPAILHINYQILEGFFFDFDGDGESDQPVGTCIPFLDNSEYPLTGGVEPVPTDIAYEIDWPEAPPELHVGETLIEPKNDDDEGGLPDICPQCSVEIIYDQALEDGVGKSAKLLEVMSEQVLNVCENGLTSACNEGVDPLQWLGDDGIKTRTEGSNTVIFPDLPPHLIDRVSYDYLHRELKFKGFYDDESTVGEPVLLLNIMTVREKQALLDLGMDAGVVNALFVKTRGVDDSRLAGVDEIVGTDVFKVLTAGAARGGTGHVLLAFNNNEEFCQGNPVTLEVIKVSCDHPYRGELKVIEPENVFDEKVTFKHTGDFAGQPEDLVFQWKYSPSILKPDPLNTTPGVWHPVNSSEGEPEPHLTNGIGPGVTEVTIGGVGVQTLQDKWITMRYSYIPDPRCDGWKPYNADYADVACDLPEADPNENCVTWSEWTEPQLYENWVKRVIRQINPFEQRYKNFHEIGVATYVDMIEQAGERYEGPVALNNDPDYLDSLGLIAFYETLLKTAKELSIDSDAVGEEGGANNAILFAASRVSDLYMLLGNEAYADAGDPTIGFTTESGDFTVAPSIFCFQNQMDSLLQEELELLRGRDETRQPNIEKSPVYNRAIWNFTSGDGELAYKMNYAVDTEEEARTRFPQGHGDAWGHYLTAIKKYYDLLTHKNFDWVPQPESVLVAGTDVLVDYRDERKFASAAAARARTGAEIVNLTYRDKYVENPEGQWQGYKDPVIDKYDPDDPNDDEPRAWGVFGWASRAAQGAYLDWVVGNAMLPPPAETVGKTGIEKIDRKTVTELAEVVSRLSEIQATVDEADMGLNPLGVAKDAIPFDISPLDMDAGKTHFEQIYDRAVQALNSAIVVFDHANQNTQMLRRQQDSLEDFQNNVEDREADFNNRLIEIYGYPYEEDICLGCTYPPGYDGPDIIQYARVDASQLMDKTPKKDTFEFTVQVTDFLDVDRSGGLEEQTRDVTFHVSTEGFGMVKPAHWTSSRRAPGEIQMARSDLLLTKTRFEKALIEYNNLIMQIEDEADLLKAQYDLNAEHINILYGTQAQQLSLNNAIMNSRKWQLSFRTIAKIATYVANAVSEALPTNSGVIVGMAGGVIADMTAPARSGIQIAATVINESMSTMADVLSLSELASQQAKEIVQSQSNIKITSLQGDFAVEQKLKQIEQMIRSEASLRLELFTLQENIQQTAGRYMSALARGERLLQDRTRFRQQTADDIREYRYKDMAFRIFRNDALQKYRAQFDLAARYVYLAAKAYDYDTGLLDSSTWSGEQFLNDIVKQRTIGEINGGIPMTGSGLADAMAQMGQNFSILKPQLGFNNPQLEENRFSLREELFRIRSGYASNEQWQTVLAQSRVDNLWDLPEFRRYCIPFDAEYLREPAIVLRFPTNITSRLNYFGWPLGGGDSYYDSSRFSTKVRGVGVWLGNYDNTNLVETPRVYFIPIGEDIIRSPYGYSGSIRSFQVIDQVLPVPFPVAADDFENDLGWIPIVDGLLSFPGNFFDIRRHSRFRAYHDGGSGWSNEIQYDARLIGRSVWNTEWLLVIPGASLYYDPDEGLDRFIYGQLVPGQGGQRDGNGVSDIKMSFETYSYEGY